MTSLASPIRWLLLAALLAPAAPARAQQSGNGPQSSPSTPAARPRPVMRATLRTGAIAIDGRIDEAAWDVAPAATDFVQSEPDEGTPSANHTEVRVLFDESAFYVSARMFDPEPDKIGRQLVRRDDRGPFFDWFSVSIDPNHDKRSGYAFQVNAAGVQSDRTITDDHVEDITWDAVWESATSVDSLGWSLEIRIPLTQIRYTSMVDGPRTWGINFTRRRVNDAEMSHFALFVRTRQQEEGNVSRFGTLEGVVVPSSVRRIAARPYALTSFHSGPATPGDPFFDGSSGNLRVGSDFRLGLGSAFTLDATVNPDFGQVEADPADINLTAFETFFDERRPFFVEDGQTFDFRLGGGGGGGGGGGRGGGNQLFYSRRIGRAPHGDAPDGADFSQVPEATSILGAAKLTGRSASGLTMGFLSAVTQAENGSAFDSDTGVRSSFQAEPLTEYAVASAQQDLNGGLSQIGGIVTALHRELPGEGLFDFLPGEAYAAGLRFDHMWGDRAWRLNGYAAGSHVRGEPAALVAIQRASNHYFQRPDATRARVDSAATSLSGAEWRLQIDRQNARHWIGSAWVAEATKGFEVNDLGFSSSRERMETGARVGYREIRPGKLFRDYNVTLNGSGAFSHEAFGATGWRRSMTGGSFGLSTRMTLLNFHMFDVGAGWTPDLYSRTATRGGPVMIQPGNRTFGAGFNSDRRGAFSVNGSVDVTKAALDAGHSFSVNGTVNLRPSSQMLLEIQPRYSRQTDRTQYVGSTSTLAYAPTFGRRYLFGDLERQTLSVQTRANYIFSPTLSLQLYAEPLLSSGDYVGYKQLAAPGTFGFRHFEEGSLVTVGGETLCSVGSICRANDTQYVDFDGDARTDYSFADRDFNVRSLIGNAVLRWEYRPGSTIFLVWQRAQESEVGVGDFAFGRDVDAMWAAPADNRFILKVNYWLGL